MFKFLISAPLAGLVTTSDRDCWPICSRRHIASDGTASGSRHSQDGTITFVAYRLNLTFYYHWQCHNYSHWLVTTPGALLPRSSLSASNVNSAASTRLDSESLLDRDIGDSDANTSSKFTCTSSLKRYRESEPDSEDSGPLLRSNARGPLAGAMMNSCLTGPFW